MDEPGSPYDIATGEMLQFAGKQVTINKARSYGYTLDETGNFNWTDAMFDECAKTDWGDDWDGSTTVDEIIGLISGHL